MRFKNGVVTSLNGPRGFCGRSHETASQMAKNTRNQLRLHVRSWRFSEVVQQGIDCRIWGRSGHGPMPFMVHVLSTSAMAFHSGASAKPCTTAWRSMTSPRMYRTRTASSGFSHHAPSVTRALGGAKASNRKADVPIHSGTKPLAHPLQLCLTAAQRKLADRRQSPSVDGKAPPTQHPGPRGTAG